MKVEQGSIQVGAPFPGTVRREEGGLLLTEEFACEKGPNGENLPPSGHPVIYVDVSRGANPPAGVQDQTLYMNVLCSDGERGSTSIDYDVTCGGAFPVPACTKIEVTMSAVGQGGASFNYRVSSAWRQGNDGGGYWCTRPITLPAGAASAQIPVPKYATEFFAEGTGTAANLAATAVRKYTKDARLISTHDGAEDVRAVSGSVAYVVYQCAVSYDLIVNFRIKP